MEMISRRKVLEYMADYKLTNQGVAMDWTEAIDDIFAEVEKMPIVGIEIPDMRHEVKPMKLINVQDSEKGEE